MSCKVLLPCALVAITLPGTAFAQYQQAETALRQFFEGKRVTLKLDMPATDNGVDVRLGANPPIDFEEYGVRMRLGNAIRSGDSALVTRVRIKDKLIEFQLDGGGYTGSESDYVYVPSADKTQREKDLERDIKNETDSRRKRQMQDDLDRLRRDRYREDQRAQAAAKATAEMSRQRIREERLHAGSRFNIRYQPRVPLDVTPADVMRALAEYVDFGPVAGGRSAPAALRTEPAVVRAEGRFSDGPLTPLSKGMTRDEVEEILGKPTQVADRAEGTLKASKLTFSRPDVIVRIDLVDNVVVRFSIESR